MDIISRAMKKNLHICKDEKLMKQTWKDFENQGKGKKIFLFGTGAALDYYFYYYKERMMISGVLDNDKKKQGECLEWFCVEAQCTKYENMTIQSPHDLEEYESDEVMVLITSTQYYQEIIQQLNKMNIYSCYSLLMMEVNRRKAENIKEKDTEEIREEHIKWCCNQNIAENKIVMIYGVYGENIKYITDQLMRSGKQLDIVWIGNGNHVNLPDGVRKVPADNWKRYTYELETAKIWIAEVMVDQYIKKRDNQFYIQTKHWSSITLKAFYLEDPACTTTPQGVEAIKRNGEMMDYLFSGSKFDEDSCKSGFAFHGKAARIGSSRSDILFDRMVRKEVFDYFHVSTNARILLYAPTYRQRERDTRQCIVLSLDMIQLLQALRQKTGEDWYIFVRLHPLLNVEKSNLIESDRIINASTYPESEKLVAASDMMITDYSSIMFEGAFIKQPVFLYAPDRKEYINNERGLLLDYDSLPFPIAESNEELIQNIRKFDRLKYEKDVEDFLNLYEVHEDGHASERAAQAIIELMETGEIKEANVLN